MNPGPRAPACMFGASRSPVLDPVGLDAIQKFRVQGLRVSPEPYRRPWKALEGPSNRLKASFALRPPRRLSGCDTVKKAQLLHMAHAGVGVQAPQRDSTLRSRKFTPPSPDCSNRQQQKHQHSNSLTGLHLKPPEPSTSRLSKAQAGFLSTRHPFLELLTDPRLKKERGGW